ncbi:inositol 5-phosphatase 2 [Tieghemostelium lacteum]|uniref:Inositol 5-phosphatase 2 n=1 Tax=Tieghemostelium lacteum TaxID=361077 RepID=A0A151ZG04_TIELA|nr:inositol 5-phosphatase 2 [Tieghemostelium lacteum]|eukprot:KYQ92857.1 inositol 5-phosphatase 2 [Tieghemostelium lacteum]
MTNKNINTRPCTQCAGLSFSEDENGFLECDICHTRVVGFFSQEVDAFESGYRLNEFKRVVDPNSLLEKSPFQIINQDNRYYILQQLLREQVKALIKDQHLNEQLYQVTGDLWHCYLTKIYNLDYKESVNTTNSNDLDSSFNNNKNNNNTTEDTLVTVVNRTPNPFITLAICYLSLVWLKEPIILSDMIRYIQQGQIPCILPKMTWCHHFKLNYETLYKISLDLSKFLNFKPLPNIPLILLRFCTELSLPKYLLNLSIQLYNIISIDYFKSQKSKLILKENYELLMTAQKSELLCCSLLVVVLKSEFNLLEPFDKLTSGSRKSVRSIDISEDTEEFQLDTWIFHLLMNIPKNKFISKKTMWDLSTSDVVNIPKRNRNQLPSSSYLTTGLYSKYTSFSRRLKPSSSSPYSTGTNNQNSRYSIQEFKSFLAQPEPLDNIYQDNLQSTIKYPILQTNFKKGSDCYSILVNILSNIIKHSTTDIHKSIHLIEDLYLKNKIDPKNQSITIK